MLRRRLPAALCAAAALLALTACTAPQPSATPSASAAPSTAPSAGTSTPPPAPTPSASPSALVTASATEQQYLGFVSQFSPTLAATPQTTLLTLGRQVCDGFRRGQDAATVSTALGSSTLAPDLQATDAAVIIGAAVAQLCPQYRSALDG